MDEEEIIIPCPYCNKWINIKGDIRKMILKIEKANATNDMRWKELKAQLKTEGKK